MASIQTHVTPMECPAKTDLTAACKFVNSKETFDDKILKTFL